MKTTNIWASLAVVIFLGLTSCGGGQRAESDDTADTIANDSVPPSGENEYQNDLEPQTKIDSLPDSTVRKP